MDLIIPLTNGINYLQIEFFVNICDSQEDMKFLFSPLITLYYYFMMTLSFGNLIHWVK